MSKYDALRDYLHRQSGDEVPMTFVQIEKITGVRLPRSASIRAWWSNNPTNSVLTKVWLSAGFKTAKVDMAKRKLVFVRNPKIHGFAEEAEVFESNKPVEPKTGRHPLIGILKGTFTIEPGWDLTKPALDPEELEAWEANLDRTADLIEEGLRKKKP